MAEELNLVSAKDLLSNRYDLKRNYTCLARFNIFFLLDWLCTSFLIVLFFGFVRMVYNKEHYYMKEVARVWSRFSPFTSLEGVFEVM